MRNRDWTTRLHAEIKAAAGRPFSWGEHDCCTFAGDCALAVCGIDPAAETRGRYTTRVGAKRVLKNTHGSLEGALDKHFNRVPIKRAQRGDLVLFESPDGRCLGVIWAGGVFCVTEAGVSRAVADPLIAWRVE